jgi:multidrug resistance efflux pump
VPVRVKLDEVPDAAALVVGRTATVVVQNATRHAPLSLVSWGAPASR